MARRSFLCAVLISLLLLAPALAQAQLSPGPLVTWEDAPGPVRKLGRGLANTLFGFLELPLAIQRVHYLEGAIPASTFGVASGLAAAATRTALGIYEVITFPFPLSKSGFRPLVEPEFVRLPPERLP